MNNESDVTVNPYTLEGMIARVKWLPGWTMYPPHMDALGDRVEIAKQIAEATGTVLEWNEGGSPRFMPKDETLAEVIRAGWRKCDLDVKDYAPPKRRAMTEQYKLCRHCGQPMKPKGVKKLPNEYDHASGCPCEHKDRRTIQPRPSREEWQEHMRKKKAEASSGQPFVFGPCDSVDCAELGLEVRHQDCIKVNPVTRVKCSCECHK